MNESIEHSLLEGFQKDLQYYPVISTIPDIRGTINKLISYMASVMRAEDRIGHSDIQEAIEAMNMLKMALVSTYQPNAQLTGEEVIGQAINRLHPLWPLSH